MSVKTKSRIFSNSDVLDQRAMNPWLIYRFKRLYERAMRDACMQLWNAMQT